MKNFRVPLLLSAWAALASLSAWAGVFDRPAQPGPAPLYSVSPYGSLYEYPHSAVYGIGCDSCHCATSPTVTPDWATFVQQNPDDTLFNSLCWSCHNDIVAPAVKTHSSLSNDNSYGNWSMECRTCHQPHWQDQKYQFQSESYLFQGFVSSLSDNSVTSAGAGWVNDQFQRMIVYPDALDWPYHGYRILSNSSDTLYVAGPMAPGTAAPGSPFAIIFGKSVHSAVATPSSGVKTVRYFRGLGPKSLSDGDGVYDGVCEVCHTATVHYRNNGSSDHSHKQGVRCTQCHRHKTGFKIGGGGAHAAHENLVSCDAGALGCHGANEPPLLADNQALAATTKCNRCHSTTGAAVAKTYWNVYGTTGSWSSALGEISFCGSCHNPSPGYGGMDSGGDPAPDVMGNNTTFGFGVTGHGKPSGNYPRLSWQSASAAGNPAAARLCSACHDLVSPHYNNAGNRLKAGFENDNTNGNCRQCHDPGTAAVGAPPWYATYSAYQASAHAALKCTDCHDVHGKSGAYAGMTTANRQALCLQAGCHTGMSGHALGVSFGRGGQSYSLECVSCHNVHIVTGRISATDTTKTPLSQIANNTLLWGGVSGQKMNDFAGTGTYRTPNGDPFTGAQLPDYPTFCLECHGQNMTPSIHGNISWNDLHGRGAAGGPNGWGVCPNWYNCGLAFGWDGDDCTGGDNVCWPVINRGYGDELYSRLPYNHDQRVAGANFVISCNDCHSTHAVSSGSWKLRGTINGGGITGEWKTICNACHYYYSDWHAGMSCGNANSCHDANPNSRLGCCYETIHGMSNMGHGGGTRTVDNTLVLDLRFENNLKDSGSFALDSKWYDNTGTYTAGKSGQAITLNNATNTNVVQVGTENQYWSTDAGYHNTWNITEMKFNTTLQAWVRPTDSTPTEMILFTKHVGINDGGYQFLLKKIGGNALRAAFTVAADNNASSQGGKAGIRGAYSSVTIPLNVWTHVAATFDRNGPDRNASNPSVGRIRIYVNGIDVTTSDASGNYVQPGAGETSIYAYSENSPWNQSICFNGVWCTSEFLIGGFPWSGGRFIGSIDEAKVWNVTKDNNYFAAFDSQAGPYISTATGQYTSNQLTVVFSEGVYTNNNQTGDLVPEDFVLTDADNGRAITGISHTAGSNTATLTLSSPFDSTNDINVDTLGLAANAVYDRYGVAGETAAVTITGPQTCPTGQVVFNLNEPAGSAFAFDNSMLLAGTVSDPADTLRGDGRFFGDAVNNYILFLNNQTCMKATTNLTLEARIKPTGLGGTTTYARRIFAKDSSNNYQVSVWRNNSNLGVPNFNAPAGRASIAFWLNPVDVHGGQGWKVVLTDHSLCPIVSDHWYVVKTVWDSSKPGGVAGQPFVPADIYIEDQGTSGAYNDNVWAGSLNCTKADQGYHGDNTAIKVYTGDVINASDSPFAIGVNASATGNHFNGQIDWIQWSDAAGPPPGAPSREWDAEFYLFWPAP